MFTADQQVKIYIQNNKEEKIKSDVNFSKY